MKNRLLYDEDENAPYIEPWIRSYLRDKEQERIVRLDRIESDRKEQMRNLISPIISPVPYIYTKVKEWVHVCNPVIGTCRHCGCRDFVDDPVIGLY